MRSAYLAQAVFVGLPVLLAGTRRFGRFRRWVRREERAYQVWRVQTEPAWAQLRAERTAERHAQLRAEMAAALYGRHARRPGRVNVARLLAQQPPFPGAAGASPRRRDRTRFATQHDGTPPAAVA